MKYRFKWAKGKQDKDKDKDKVFEREKEGQRRKKHYILLKKYNSSIFNFSIISFTLNSAIKYWINILCLSFRINLKTKQKYYWRCRVSIPVLLAC